MFFADEWAQDVRSEHDPPYTVRAGWSPSGAPHPGHLQEVLCAEYVYRALGGDELVIGIDDRDALRSDPSVLHDGENEQEGPFGLASEIGRPLVFIDDPFGCCESFAEHNRRLLQESLHDIGVEATFVSMDEQWRSGDLRDSIETLHHNWEAVRERLGHYQKNPPRTVVRPICGSCGRIAVGLSVEDGRVTYRCDATHGAGCGEHGTAALNNSALPWRLRWPVQWARSGAVFEPYGRDHESSAESGRAIADVLDWSVPTLRRYEWWELNGDALSSSEGALTLPRLLGYLPPSAARWLSTRNPRRTHPVSLDSIPEYIDRFRAEYRDGQQGAQMAQVEDVVAIDYTTAAHAGCLQRPEQRLGYLRSVGCDIDDVDDGVVLRYVDRAYRFARDLRPEQFYSLTSGHSTDHGDFVRAVARSEPGTASDWDEQLRDLADEYDLSFGEACRVLYNRLFGTDNGPRIAALLAQLTCEDRQAYLG